MLAVAFVNRMKWGRGIGSLLALGRLAKHPGRTNNERLYPGG